MNRLRTFFIVTGLGVSGLSLHATFDSESSVQKVSTERVPKGTTGQQIEYHKNKIKKHIAAVGREDQNIMRFQSQRKFSEARSANLKKEQHIKEIDRHTKAIKELKGAS